MQPPGARPPGRGPVGVVQPGTGGTPPRTGRPRLFGGRRQPDAVPLGEPRGQRAYHLAGPHPDLPGQFLRRQVRLVEVVLTAVEELADLLVRGARQVAAAAPQLGGLREPRQRLVAPPEVEQHLRHPRQPRGQFGDFGGRDPCRAHLVGQRFPQIRQHPGGVPFGEEAGVHSEDLGQPQQHGHRQRARVVLHLVQIARRDRQHPGQLRLAQTALLAQPAQPRSRVGPAHPVALPGIVDLSMTLTAHAPGGPFATLAKRAGRFAELGIRTPLMALSATVRVGAAAHRTSAPVRGPECDFMP